MTGVVLVLALGPASPPEPSDAEALAAAERAFADGVGLRHDAARARPAFARAAAGYDGVWARGYHTPELALNRAAAHRLAGDLPRAVVALNEGRRAAPWSRAVQVALDDARSAVAYPAGLEAQCRPVSRVGLRDRVSPAEAWAVAAGLWLLACAAAARFAMTRRAAWLMVAVLSATGLVAAAGFWLHDRDEDASPVVVLADDAVLRKGNADTYPARLDGVLPHGAEARVLGERGGWVQVRLAGGAVGWLPAGAVLRPGRSRSAQSEPDA
ncbi:MAG: hypothetical protein C0501_25270 [Isosphaera sp.]|nr:hypothetical protein [Isosphaera sp.]